MSARADATPLAAAEAETAVVGACLIDRGARDTVRAMGLAADLAAPAHGALLDAMWALDDRDTGADRDGAIDPVTLSAELERRGTLALAGGRDYVAFLVDCVPHAHAVPHHAALVRAAARRRALHAVGQRLSALAHDPAIATDAAARDGAAALLPLGVDGDAPDAPGFRPMAERLWPVMERLEARAAARHAGTVLGVPTGYPELDDIFHGFGPGEFIVLGAGPKVGKTALALNLALSATLVGARPGAFVSAEMLRDEVAEASLAAVSGVDRVRMQKGTLTSADYAALAAAAQRLQAGAPLHVDDEAFPSLDSVIARATHLKTRFPDIAFLVVDYLQLVTKRLEGRREDAEINAVCRGLKGLAKRLGIPVLAPAQTNYKETDGRANARPTLRDLQGASGMAQTANAVLLLYRDAMLPHVLEVEVAASRRTDRAALLLAWDGARMRVGSPRLHGLPPYAEPVELSRCA